MKSQPTLGICIRKLRLQKGLSQETLGELANLHRNFVSDIERGNKGITLDTLFELSKALEVSPESIITKIYEH